MTDNKEQNINNQEKNSKAREIFNKYKDENNMISEESLNEILNELGRKITLEQSSELIKKINGQDGKTEINFEQFIELIENESDNKKLPDLQLYIYILILFVTGSINTIINKIQQSVNAKDQKFEGHQEFITFCMFLGEFLCLLFYYITKNKESLINKDNGIKFKKDPKIWYFVFPAVLDFLGSTISTISLTFLNSSIYQMLRGALIIFICVGTIIFLKTKYYRHHFLGIFIVVLGLIIVGINAVIYDDNKSSGKNPALGIFLIIFSQLFTCFQLIIEEKLLKTYEISPLKAVGLEGMWGSMIYIVFLFIFNFIDCKKWSDTLKQGMCIKEAEDNIKFENVPFAFEQMGDQPILILYLLIFILSIAFFNFSGLTVAKYDSSTLRSIVDTLRTIAIWAFFLIMPFVPKETKEKFHWLQLLGFIILILGGAIYNEIIIIPFLGLSDNTKKAKKRRDEFQKELTDIDKGLLN